MPVNDYNPKSLTPDLEFDKFGAGPNNEVIINTIVRNGSDNPVPVSPAIAGDSLFEYTETPNVAPGASSVILAYQVPVGKNLSLKDVLVSGDSRAIYLLKIDGNIKVKIRTYFTEFNSIIKLSDARFLPGQLITVEAKHDSVLNSDFNATLNGTLE